MRWARAWRMSHGRRRRRRVDPATRRSLPQQQDVALVTRVELVVILELAAEARHRDPLAGRQGGDIDAGLQVDEICSSPDPSLTNSLYP